MQDWERLYMDDPDAWCERQIEALNRHRGKLPADLDGEGAVCRPDRRDRDLAATSTTASAARCAAISGASCRACTRKRAPISRKAAYGKAHIADRFPDRCPYSLDQVVGDCWPTGGDGGETSP